MASPQLDMILQIVRANEALDDGASVEKMRQGMDSVARMFTPPAGTRREEVHAGSVPCEWLSHPESDEERVVFYLHGGGYLLGSRKSHRHLVAQIAKAGGCRALSVEYRLAPEHPHPAAVEDATAAYKWLLDQGIDPSRVVISGDSAGGGLTVATLVALRDEGVPLPAAAVCLSPWVDLEGEGETMTSLADVDVMVKREKLLEMATDYLSGAHPRTPLAAPLHAELKGLPPMLIHVGAHETLLDDSRRLAEKARKAGVEVALEIWDHMIHVWHFFSPMLPEGAQAIEKIGAYIREKTE